MNEVRKPALMEGMPDLSASFVQVSSDATRRLCEHGQSVAKKFSEWNAEVSHFLSQRVARNSDAMGRMAKCQSYPEVCTIQAQWVQEAADDYMKQISKLMDANSRIMGGLLGSFRQFEVQSAEEQNSPLEKVSKRATN